MLKRLSRDRAFWIAVLSGPAFWWALTVLGAEQINMGDGSALWPRLLWLAGFYPIVEEGLFRGLLQPLFLQYKTGRARRCGISGANGITTALFVFFHFFFHPPLWAFSVAVPSLIFGGFRDRYQSVVPAILLHSFYNGGYFSLSMF
ncbi:MAG: JDVT-CTERM system glutamic-type intramembrane protease [Nitrospiria bacterium]